MTRDEAFTRSRTANKHAVTLYPVGDFYEAFGQDATLRGRSYRVEVVG